MRIVQITPGVIPIPPNGWGAVEKIIWEYKLSLDKIGYQTHILYADDVKNEEGQIVHVHMANLANLLHQRGIDYVFSLHDHHVEHFGKDSECYRQNYEAIKNSKLAFVHSKHLIDYFDNMPQIVYLQHGANLKDYRFSDRCQSFRQDGKSLVMMANNGVGGDPLADRKGFLIGIEAAKILNMHITIICPGSNREFFQHHKPEYSNLEILYDLDYQSAIERLNQSDIFLHPSNLEAGHPNLTITESLAMGIPVVGTSNVDAKGLIRVERSVEAFVSGIKKCLAKYDSLVSDMENYRYLLSWDIIVSKMLKCYKSAYSVSQKNQLTNSYKSTKKSFSEKQSKPGISVEFKSSKAFVKTSLFSDGMHAVFKDKRTNRILFHSLIGKTPGQWAYIYSPEKQFIEWRVEVKQGTKIIYSEDLELENKRVLLNLETEIYGLENTISKFVENTGCHLTIKSKGDISIEGCCFDEAADEEEFYYSLNQFQLTDFFEQKEQIKDSELLLMSSNALGDTIAFLPYAQKWSQKRNKTVDVVIKHNIFEQSEYPNIRLIDKNSINYESYTDIHIFEYIFSKPLQLGYSDQFNLEYEETRPVIRKSGKKRPIKERYVCIGVQTTAQCKYWNYPGGWEKLCEMLIEIGLIPVAVDLHEVFGIEGYWNSLPKSAIKKVGMPFIDVVNYIEHCEFFIGVSSGLSWLAHGLGKKTVMISGTTKEDNEFKTDNYKVINKSVCNGCFNKPEIYNFKASDWLWCPANKGTERQFECTKEITPEMVFDVIVKNMSKKEESIGDYLI